MNIFFLNKITMFSRNLTKVVDILTSFYLYIRNVTIITKFYILTNIVQALSALFLEEPARYWTFYPKKSGGNLQNRKSTIYYSHIFYVTALILAFVASHDH
jgi:hypothetical protein